MHFSGGNWGQTREWKTGIPRSLSCPSFPPYKHWKPAPQQRSSCLNCKRCHHMVEGFGIRAAALRPHLCPQSSGSPGGRSVPLLALTPHAGVEAPQLPKLQLPTCSLASDPAPTLPGECHCSDSVPRHRGRLFLAGVKISGECLEPLSVFHFQDTCPEGLQTSEV